MIDFYFFQSLFCVSSSLLHVMGWASLTFRISFSSTFRIMTAFILFVRKRQKEPKNAYDILC